MGTERGWESKGIMSTSSWDHCITAQSGDMEEDEFMSGRKKTGKMLILPLLSNALGAISSSSLVNASLWEHLF
jgi:hypothetical protein